MSTSKPKMYPEWHPMHDRVQDMTLRDYFAAKAMQGEISRTGYYQSEDFMLIAAKRAYVMADAMLKAREQ